MQSASRRPWRRACAWLAFLGPFFFASYGLANWLASRRAEVAALAFDWESRIPFLAWTIVPYWSIDFLYAASFFICASRRELDVHAKRLLLAQGICVACFIAFPLRFSFERPQSAGFFGWMFDLLMGFDKPFNQAPSLHIALAVILWLLYLRHAGRWRWLVHGGFGLIVVSVLTTYQHHFVDVPTGLAAGWLCVWLIPDAGRSPLAAARFTADPARLRLALIYAAGAALAGTAALYVGGWALWLLWVAGALGMVSLIYAALGEGAFQKALDGSLSPAVRWLLAPYLAGAWLNSRWWTRSCAAASPVLPGLWIGRLPTRAEREALGVRAVVDVSAELPCNSRGIHYFSVPQLDLVLPSAAQLQRAVQAIESALRTGPVLVCCALGFSRSAAAVAAWLAASGRARDMADAIEQVRRARPAAVIGDR